MEILIAALTSIALQCPSHIQDRQDLVTPIEGWKAVSTNRKKRLIDAAVYLGSPTERESVQPEKKGSVSLVWKGIPSGSWVECKYVNTSLKLWRSLDSAKSGVFTPSADGTADPATMICR